MIARFRSFTRSIRFRLALWFVAILAVVLVVFSAFVYARQVNDMRQETVDRLDEKTRDWQTYLKYAGREYFGANPPLIPDQTRDGEPFLQEYDVLALVGQAGQVVQKAGPIEDVALQALVQTGLQDPAKTSPFDYTLATAGANGDPVKEDYRFVVAPIAYERQVIGYFILGSPVDPYGLLPRLLVTLALGSLATLGLALAGGVWLADRAMRPVKTITRAAREIGETDLNRRLNLSGQDELGELAATFDGMLVRLQAAFDRQRQFTADASHELRTPLTIIGLEANRSLAAPRSASEYRRALTVIQAENDWMARLVNNLLTLSRMDAGQAILAREPVDLSDVALEVVERLAPLAASRSILLQTGELPEVIVSADRQLLAQALANLVENAIKYTPQEAGRVRVEVGSEPSGSQANAWVRVQDNGTGIAPEHLPRLFDRFYQVDRARTRGGDGVGEEPSDINASSGSGLGLAIVQWIVQAHDGRVTVESEVDEGTTFTVWLPA